MPLTELYQEAAFEADVIQSMAKAFELACGSLHDGSYPNLIREIIAKRILAFAQQGVTDPCLLCETALDSLGLQNDAP